MAKRKPPEPAEQPDPSAYERRRERARAGQAAQAKRGRDCGPIPPIADVERRARCRSSLRLFCETYNPEGFYLGWSDDHLRAIARLEEAALQGALFCFAMPRGSGKTTLCRMAALWALSYSIRRYVFLIGANASKAADTLDALKSYARFLPDFAADFTEISVPVQALAGIANRASGQLSDGEPTMIEWAQDRVMLPTVRPPENWPKDWPLRADGCVPTSGSIASASGLTGDGIRGSLLTLTTGESIRPDLVLLDDPQTDESARSQSQNDSREQLISGAVLGMAGPGKTISAVMPCTVIRPDDMVDRLLDRSKHPLWRGERTKLLRSMPSDLDAWDPYFELYRADAQREPPDFAESAAYYAAHQAELEAGAVASWPQRKLDGELSAIQHAMHLYCRNVRAFFSEYQNDPLADEDDAAELTPDDITARINRHERRSVPLGCTRLTAMIDVQKDLLYYCVAAWDDGFGGSIIDYGTYPEQRRTYFALRDARPTLGDKHAGKGLEGALYAGLDALTRQLLGAEWRREDGAGMRIERCLVDANWGQSTDLVYKFCRESVHAGVLTPSHGKYVGAGHDPLTKRKKQQGERFGLNWVVPLKATRPVRYVLFDSNWWKSFVHARLAAAIGGAGALVLFGDRPDRHRLFAEHLTAEYRVKLRVDKPGGRAADEWKWKPGRPDNHWLDCVVGAAVAASMQGTTLAEVHEMAKQPGQRKQVSFRELRDAQRKREQGANIKDAQPNIKETAPPAPQPKRRTTVSFRELREEQRKREQGLS